MQFFPAQGFKGFSPRAIGLAATALTVLIWTSFVLIARASADPAGAGALTPFDITFCRIVGASLVLLPWGAALVRRDRARGVHQASLFGLSPLSLRVTLTTGLAGGLLYPLLAYNGFVFAPALHASVLMTGSLPLWTALLAWLLLRERIPAGRALGLGCIALGCLLVGGASLWRAFGVGDVWRGDLLFMSASLCWAAYSVLARRHALDAVRATIAVTVFALVTYVPVYTALAFGPLAVGHLRTAPLEQMLFQAVFQGWISVLVAGITFTRMIQHFGPVRSTMITALVPGLAALGAVLFLGEPLHWNLSAGLALVTLGILFGVRAAAPGAPRSTVAAAAAREAGR